MRADLINKTKTLTGTSDLTLLAPLKQGLVPSLEAVSYKTRTQRVLKLLNGTRASSHEFALQRPLSDSAERVARIHSVRVIVFEPENLVLLSVSFDGTWESYLRVLWQKVGTLLDVIFCNTEDYVLSTGSYEAWCGWVRRVQRDTGFFFTTHALTVQDVEVLRAEAQVHCSEQVPAVAQLLGTRVFGRSAEDIAYEAGQTTTERAVETVRQGLQALALLYRMADLYLPGTDDGDVLLRAARDLLTEFCCVSEDEHIWEAIDFPMRQRFDRQLVWLASGLGAQENPARRPRTPPPVPQIDGTTDVQAGILAGYDDANCGCLVLVAFDDAAACATLLDAMLKDAPAGPRIEAERADVFGLDKVHKGAGPFYNLWFTHEGLRRAGMTEQQLAQWLPLEFREGMEARASVLGDFRANHPRRWRLPRLNWKVSPQARHLDVQLSAVHAIVQIRRQLDTTAAVNLEDPAADDYALQKEVEALSAAAPGMRILSVQGMRRRYDSQRRGQIIDHFGYADGGAQPELTPTKVKGNQVELGEILLGYANDADPAPCASSQAERARLEFLRNGTFLVVRKLRQNVALLDKFVDSAAAKGLERELVFAKMMGRWRHGGSLIGYPDGKPPTPADPIDQEFDYSTDPVGSLCPIHSHIRRVNPRMSGSSRSNPPGGRRARILRRGMSYGLPRADGAGKDDDERGLVFIACNASIAEQFEVVQRWISGGNSSGGYSGQSDPFLGVPEPGQSRHFRFEVERSRGPEVITVALDSGPEVFREPEPIVRLEWGAYLFVPSMPTLRWLAKTAKEAGSKPRCGWSASAGARQIEQLPKSDPGGQAACDAWKCAIEDPGADEQLHAASLWAAVRGRGGALRTPYGVLVGSRGLIDEVLGDDKRFSMCGHLGRMQASNFEIYLGLDAGERYGELSTGVNAAIMAIGEQEAFDLASVAARDKLKELIKAEVASARATGALRWELNLDAREVFDAVLQSMCQQWLDLPAGKDGELTPDGWRWKPKIHHQPVYPMHFTPPSRYFFQPQPSEEVRRYGVASGVAVVEALTRLVQRRRAAWAGAPAPNAGARLARAIVAAMPEKPDEEIARNLAGTLMGFLPTLDGNLRSVLNEWLRVQTFWSLRAQWAADPAPLSLGKAKRLIEGPLRAAMQFAPAPALIWRTARVDGDRIGGVDLQAGDIVVLGLVSATQAALENGGVDAREVPDVMPAFGGDRLANRHPTHACPGYAAAMGIMLGTFAALVHLRRTVRPSPAAVSFTIERHWRRMRREEQA